MLRLFSLLCLMFIPASAAMAQTGTPTKRYLIAARGSAVIQPSVFEASLPHPLVPPGEWAIYNDALHTTLAVINLTPSEYFSLLVNHREYILEEDQQMSPNSCETPDPVPTGWALQSLLSALPCGLPVHNGCIPKQVTLFVVDSGVQKMIGATPHPQFDATSAVVWGSGLMTPSLTGSGASPFIDLHDHGTGVASTAVGKDTGLFSHLPGASVILEPCQIYYPSISPPQAPWVSDAVNVIYAASVQHLARKLDANLLNNGSVMLFANRTQNLYSEIMERQLAEASNAGIIVIVAAGNKAASLDPKTPSMTMPSMGVSQIIPPSGSTKTPSGLPLGGILGDPSQPSQNYATPLSKYLILVGATQSDTQLWTSDAGSGTNYGLGADLFAPGWNITRASSGGLTNITGSGTSFSTGYVAGLALYYLSFRPWAPVGEVRNFVLTYISNNIATPVGAENGMVVHRLNLDSIVPPECCLDYETWAGLKGLSGLNPAKTEDPDKDGFVNLLEFVMGTNPYAAGTNRGLDVSNHDGNYYLRLTLAPYTFCGCTIAVEASQNLTTWSEPVPTFADVPQVNPSLTGKVSEALLGNSSSRKFYRLRVTSP